MPYSPYPVFGLNGIFSSLFRIHLRRQLLLFTLLVQHSQTCITNLLFFKFQQLLPPSSSMKLRRCQYYVVIICFGTFLEVPFAASGIFSTIKMDAHRSEKVNYLKAWNIPSFKFSNLPHNHVTSPTRDGNRLWTSIRTHTRNIYT